MISDHRCDVFAQAYSTVVCVCWRCVFACRLLAVQASMASVSMLTCFSSRPGPRHVSSPGTSPNRAARVLLHLQLPFIRDSYHVAALRISWPCHAQNPPAVHIAAGLGHGNVAAWTTASAAAEQKHSLSSSRILQHDHHDAAAGQVHAGQLHALLRLLTLCAAHADLPRQPQPTPER